MCVFFLFSSLRERMHGVSLRYPGLLKVPMGQSSPLFPWQWWEVCWYWLWALLVSDIILTKWPMANSAWGQRVDQKHTLTTRYETKQAKKKEYI